MQEAQNVKWKDNSSNRRYRIFGNEFTEYVLTHYEPKKIIIYSRDEFKQFNMANKFKNTKINCVSLSGMCGTRRDFTGHLMEWIMWYMRQH